MAPKTSQAGQKRDRSGGAERAPQHTLESQSTQPSPNQTAQTSRSAREHSQSPDCQPISDPYSIYFPIASPTQKPWLSKPFMPDRAEVEKLLITISSSNTRFIKHIHFSDSSDIFIVEHEGQERILKVVCFDLNVTFYLADEKS